MKHIILIPALTSFLLAVPIVAPNTEALFSNAAIEMEHPGYLCKTTHQQRTIHIIHHQHPVYINACDVTFQNNSNSIVTLWKDQRNTNTCEDKAKEIAIRMEDRGWVCIASIE